MLRTRVIPTLLLQNSSLVKTVRFGKFTYVGAPANTVRIFNELEVDELIFLDISATREQRTPNLTVLRDIADECFMPLAYGGGVRTVEQARVILDIGFEKIAINSSAIERPALITELAEAFGSQAVIVAGDVDRGVFGRPCLRYSRRGGAKRHFTDVVEWAAEAENRGAGELLLTSVPREGTWTGFDLDLVTSVTDAVSIPVIAHGGAGTLDHIRAVVKEANASAVALGSMVVFQKQDMGVLVNFPDRAALASVLG